jgi:glycosyltransferase involved in cell wall biosynthesis
MSSVARHVRRILRAALHRRNHRVETPPVPLALVELARSGPAPLSRTPVDLEQSLSIAVVIPSFRRGSGGHSTIVHVMRALSRLGHSVSLWLDDYEGRHAAEPASMTARRFAEFFDADDLELHIDFDHWVGADVVLATSWQTVARALLLPRAKARAYFVQDHEPDFYGASAEALFAQSTYRQGLHCIAASPWLADLLRNRYGASASHFDLAIDRSIYRPTGAQRRDDLLVFYARTVTPRRAVPLGLLALEELSRRRPEVEIALFGEDRLQAPFEHTNLGMLDPASLAQLYSRAAIGMAFSLTNPSLICLEMMASGLACVELSTDSMLATFGAGGPPALVEPDSLRICRALEQLLDDTAQRERIARAGVALMELRTWERAVKQIEEGLRAAFQTTA